MLKSLLICVIRVQGTGSFIATLNNTSFSPFIGAGSSSTGLRVSGKTLALIGGDVALAGGVLTAEQGRIELGSVGTGVVSLNPTPSGWTFGYEQVQSFQDIRLSQEALLDASGLTGGNIQLIGRQITLTDTSAALIQNQGMGPAGSISVNASESLELKGIGSHGINPSALINDNLGVGNGGDIVVSTPRLILQDGAGIATRTFSAAASGNVTINASKSVEVNGFSVNVPSIRSNISAATFSLGSGGDVIISTPELSILNRGYVISATLGTGSGGNVTVAAESVKLMGAEPSHFATSFLGATAYNTGNAGSLIINTSRLTVRDGSRVDASTGASGDAGSVVINPQESVEVSGTVPGSRNPSLVTSSANIRDLAVRQFYGLPPVPSGASGDVKINTGQLSVTNGCLISVR